MPRRHLPSLLLLIALGCSGSDEPAGGTDVDASTPAADAAPAPAELPDTLGPEDRPARLVVPDAHDGSTPLPLLVVLHGFTASGAIQDAYWGASAHARDNGYYLLLPDGTMNGDGNRFWNATDACCDFQRSGVDDVAYLRGLVAEAKEKLVVDEGRVYFAGHSNGGFMSYRMACDAAEEVTAVASLAGSTYSDETACDAAEPVSVLQVHGTADDTVQYDGAAYFPSAEETARRWAERAGCDLDGATTGEPIDLDTVLSGAETSVRRWSEGCAEGVDVALWTIEEGGHVPALTGDWMARITEWLFAHEK